MKKLYFWMILLVLIFTGHLSAFAQNEEDTKDEKKNGKFKPYSEVITEAAVTDSGLIVVHNVDDT